MFNYIQARGKTVRGCQRNSRMFSEADIFIVINDFLRVHHFRIYSQNNIFLLH